MIDSCSSSMASCSVPEWLLPVKESERKVFSRLASCIYPEADVPPRNLVKMETFPNGTLPKFIPLFLPDSQGTSYKVYVYIRSLRLLAITTKDAVSAYQNDLGTNLNEKTPQEFKANHFYLLVRKALWEMSLAKIDALAFFEPIFERFRSLEKHRKWHDPTRIYPHFPKYNKRMLVLLFIQSTFCFPNWLQECRLTAPELTKKFSWGSSTLLLNLSLRKLTIIAISDFSFGSGVYSKAYKVYNYSTGQFQVVKRCKDICSTAVDHLNKEVKIVKAIYDAVPESQSLPGIIERHHATFSFVNTINRKIYHEPLVTYYPVTLTYLMTTQDKRLHHKPSILGGIKQLFSGLSTLQRAKILHGDIKPDNIFIESFYPLTLRIADFGGAAMEGKIKLSLTSIQKTVYTPAYLNQSDLLAMTRFVRAKDLPNWINVHRARDIASLGMTCLELLSRKEHDWTGTQHLKPFSRLLVPLTQEDYWKSVQLFFELLDLSQATRKEITKMLIDAGHNNEKLVDLFMGILQDDWTMRPSPDMVLENMASI